MNIHVVREGDTIFSIAEQYEVSATKLVLDNGIEMSTNLVPGQTLVIAYPKQTYIVRVTKANSLTINSAITLADEVGATIHFDEVSQTSYFRYIDNKG
ncbi:MAG: LysM peptidoglycan-binding domain-containing protein, partial [Herbinix sp.]|nr:LysM peptidoglycan-binding domain-containing protein [Herbinix sp.]